MKILITGSSGLIGGEAFQYFGQKGNFIVAIDNNMRREFFGEKGDTIWNLSIIGGKVGESNFKHHNCDIRNYNDLEKIFSENRDIGAIIHCAAQPSHDKAKDFPLVDFGVNAVGTLNLLELTRIYCPDAAFVFMSTNKVYGDAPNEIEMIEKETRYEYSDPKYKNGINESMRIDQSTHSVFGASKVAADVMVQEYGRYFGLKTCVFRGGCLTGPTHSGVELHGFLSYLVKCVMYGTHYKIYGYRGKQVRDNIHSYDVITAMEEVIKNPISGSVYNMGGGIENNISVLEAIDIAEKISGKKLSFEYVDDNRIGDHICYISDLSKFKKDYPNWKITKSVRRIITEIIGASACGTITERYIPGDGGDKYFESYAKPISEMVKGKVLDIGCGKGYLTYMLAENQDVISVTGTDITEDPKEEHYKIKYLNINTSDLIKDNSNKYDTIVCTEHIEHLEEELQDLLMKWIYDNLSDDGIFLGSMPHPDDPNNPNVYHIKTYSDTEWNQYITKYFQKFNISVTAEENYWWWAKK